MTDWSPETKALMHGLKIMVLTAVFWGIGVLLVVVVQVFINIIGTWLIGRFI